MNWSWLVQWLKSKSVDRSISEIEPAEEDRQNDTEDDVDPKDVTMPKGKGIFVQTVERATAKGTPLALAERARDLGLSWIALLVIWQHDDKDRIYKQIQETIVECTKIGVRVWIWGWPHGDASRIDRFVDFMTDLFESNAVDGIILNAEKPLYGRAAAAESLCQSLRARLPEVSIGLSSYGPPYFHPKFPWAPFAKICQFGMPQIYDSEHNLGSDYPQKCIAGWKKVGFSELIPTWGASKSHTAQQMRDIIDRTPRCRACCWWDLNWVRSSVSRAAVIKNMNWFS